jgi:hypothetical protein
MGRVILTKTFKIFNKNKMETKINIINNKT